MSDSSIANNTPLNLPAVSVVIPTYNRCVQLDRLLQSLRLSTVSPLEIIVVDNADSDETRSLVAQHHGVRYLRSEQNLWCNGARALGAQLARGQWILFVDDDNVVSPDMVAKLLAGAEPFPEVGIAGPLMYRYDHPNQIWCAGAEVTRLGLIRYRQSVPSTRSVAASGQLDEVFDVDYFPNCFIVRRELFDRGVKFDPKVFPHNWSEVDFCMRARQAGFRTVVIPEAVDWHDIGDTGPITRTDPESIRDQARSRIAFRKRFRTHWTDWALFFGIVLPISSLVYIYELARSGQLRAGIKGYIKGTLMGILTPVNRPMPYHNRFTSETPEPGY